MAPPAQMVSNGAAQPPQNPAQSQVFAQLKALGELRDTGVPSPQEFETKKAELLARV